MEFDLAVLMPDHFLVPETHIITKLSELYESSWLIGYTVKDNLVGYILLEWYGREVEIHICTFDKCDWRKAFRFALKQIKPHCDKITGYIPEQNEEVIKMADVMKFKATPLPDRKLIKVEKELKSKGV